MSNELDMLFFLKKAIKNNLPNNQYIRTSNVKITIFKFALEITSRRATVHAGVWRQRNNCPKAIAIDTASSQKILIPEQLKEKNSWSRN